VQLFIGSLAAVQASCYEWWQGIEALFRPYSLSAATILESPNMFILLCGILGAGATFVALWHFGVLIALLGMPFGGSVAAGLAALFLSARNRRKQTIEDVPDRKSHSEVRSAPFRRSE
jgi:hypothetical protein